MRIIVVAGARPNFVKIAPLVPALRSAGFQVDVLNTGQHYDKMLSDVFFEELSIPEPEWSLEVGSGTHGFQTGMALIGIEKVLIENRPDALMVVGDVNSTVAGALAATKLGIPLIHLESGLRSGDPSMPEEINRIIADRVSSLLLTTTEEANENLRAEGVGEDRVHFVGNVMAESLLLHKEQAIARRSFERYGFERGGYILSTCHRPENTDNPDSLRTIVAALEGAPLPVLLPAHPRTRVKLKALQQAKSSNITIIDPVGYLDMLSLEEAAGIVVSDSGGVQEETCLLRTPCITIRNNTERAITSECGFNKIIPPSHGNISEAIAEAYAANPIWMIPEKWDLDVSRRVAQVLHKAEENGFPSIE